MSQSSMAKKVASGNGMRVNVGSLAERLRREIDLLSDTIGDARAEIAGLGPHALTQVDLPDASGHLGAIIRQTEDAATRIMDGAEALIELADTLEGEAGARVRDIATAMFEAASFQDLTGQHVARVMTVLGTVEERLAQLARLVGDTAMSDAAPGGATCEGPAVDGRGNDQAAVDRLFGQPD